MLVVLFTLVSLSAVSAHNLLFLGLNEKCQNGTEPWTCKIASTCMGLKNGMLKGGDVKLCSFAGREPIICCPPEPEGQDAADKLSILTVQPEIGKKANQKCKEYAEYVFRVIESPILFSGAEKKKHDECATTSETLIVGGTPAKLNEFPHMALIGIDTQKGGRWWFCGGSLISPNFILTAAHCNITRVNATIVRLGELDLADVQDRASPIDVKITEVINHPLYNPNKGYHDISLLRLEKEVELSPEIRPLCLQTSRSIKHKEAVASGWGYTSFGNHSVTSTILQKVNLSIVDDDRCMKIWGPQWAKVPEGFKPDIMMCSGGALGKDTCTGDSGGPLQVALKEPYCMYSQIGITAFGIGCGNQHPGIYTRVSAYVSWIEKIVWPE